MDPGTGAKADWYGSVLEEYKSLRAEATSARDAQLAVLRLALPTLVALMGVGVSLREAELLGPFLLAFLVPISAIFTFELWIDELQRSVRAGAVVGAIELRLSDLFSKNEIAPPLGWELWLRTPDDRRRFKAVARQHRETMLRVLTISMFLAVIAAVGFGLGIHFWPTDSATGKTLVVTLVGLGFLVFAARIVHAVSTLRHYQEVPACEEIWPVASHPPACGAPHPPAGRR